jgi:hypothetical protein
MMLKIIVIIIFLLHGIMKIGFSCYVAVLLVLVIGLAASLGLLLFRLKEAKPDTNLVTNLPSKLKLHIMKRNPEHVE